MLRLWAMVAFDHEPIHWLVPSQPIGAITHLSPMIQLHVGMVQWLIMVQVQTAHLLYHALAMARLRAMRPNYLYWMREWHGWMDGW